MKTAHRKSAHAKRQYRADPFALWKAVARTTGFNEAEQTECALPVRIAWSALKGGTANGDDIATLTDVIAICTVAGQNMDALVEETCDAARRAMCAVADRFTRCGRWGVDAAALRDIPPIVDFYEELLRVSTGGQMGALIACTGLLTYALNPAAGMIAAASACAFSAAALVDWATFAKLRGSWLFRANGSNVAGAAVDSLIFPTLAFGVLMPHIVALQFVAKVAGGAIWAALLARTVPSNAMYTAKPAL